MWSLSSHTCLLRAPEKHRLRLGEGIEKILLPPPAVPPRARGAPRLEPLDPPDEPAGILRRAHRPAGDRDVDGTRGGERIDVEHRRVRLRGPGAKREPAAPGDRQRDHGVSGIGATTTPFATISDRKS